MEISSGPSLISYAARLKGAVFNRLRQKPYHQSIRSHTRTCSTDITVKDADTGEVLVKPRNLNVGLWSITTGRRIVFGLRTYRTLGIGINCGRVDWSVTTNVAHYTFGSAVSKESKRRSANHRPPLIAIRSGYY